MPTLTGMFPSLTAVDDRLYFQADDGVHGMELWSTDRERGGPPE